MITNPKVLMVVAGLSLGVLGGIACTTTDSLQPKNVWCTECKGTTPFPYECGDFGPTPRRGCAADASEMMLICGQGAGGTEINCGNAGVFTGGISTGGAGGSGGTDPSNSSPPNDDSGGGGGSSGAAESPWSPEEHVQFDTASSMYEIDESLREDLLDDYTVLYLDSARFTLDNGAFVVQHVAAGDLAELLGLKNGDIPYTLNGKKVTTVDGVISAIASIRTSTNVTLNLYRNGRLESLDYRFVQ